MRTRVNHAVKNRLPQKCMCTTYQGTLASSRHRPCSSQRGPSFPLKNKGHTTCHVCLPLVCLECLGLSAVSRHVGLLSAVCPSVCYRSVHLPAVDPSVVCRPVCLSAVRSVCLLFGPSACCWSVWWLVGPSVCCRSICLSVCCWSVRPSARPSNCCRPVCLSAVDPSECLSVCCRSIRLLLDPSVCCRPVCRSVGLSLPRYDTHLHK